MIAVFKAKVDVDEITRIFFNRIYASWVISLNQNCILNHSWFDFCFVCLFVCILQLKFQGSPSVGLEVSVCSHFPTTPVHTVLHVYKWGGGVISCMTHTKLVYRNTIFFSGSDLAAVPSDPVWLCMWGGVSVILCETLIPTLPLLQFPRIL